MRLLLRKIMIVSLNPATGRIIKKFKSAGAQEIERKVRQARKAFLLWSNLSRGERIGHFKKLQRVIRKERSATARLIHEEMGKPVTDALGEIDDIVAGVDYYVVSLRKVRPVDFPIDQKTWPGRRVKIIFVPHGVAGMIEPWNFPFGTPMANIVPAILAGNTVVMKPSECTTLTGLKIKELFDRARFPRGVFDVLIGGSDVGKELVRSDIDKIYFTGSVSAGMDVLKNIGVKPATVELGGNDPAVVLKDADVKLAASSIITSRLTNAGQCCSSIKRIYVENEVFNVFLREAIKVVSSACAGKDYGPLIREDALRKVDRAVKELTKGGAKLIAGGKRMSGPGFWYEPTILAVPSGKQPGALCEEIFGPVIPIQPVRDAEEAVKLANDSPYGLTASIWTGDMKKGREILRKLQARMVFLNEANFWLTGGEYWGGWKSSGFVTTENKVMNALKRQVTVEYSAKV